MESISKGQSSSTINSLARIANLFEEAANYPYWNLDSVSPNQMYAAKFEVPETDEFFGPARYVLQAIYNHQFTNKMILNDDDTMVLRGKGVPESSKVTSAHQEHVSKVYQMPGSSYIVAYHTHALFQSDGGFFQAYFVESLKQAHLESSLLLQRVHGQIMISDQLLASHVPDSFFKNEYQEYIRALPGLVRIMYLQYITMMLRIFAGVTKAAMTVHITNIAACFQDCGVIRMIMHQSVLPEGLVSKADMLVGLSMFLFRTCYMPWYTIMYRLTTWNDLYLGLRHPAPFLSIDGSIGFWAAMRLGLFHFILEMMYLLPMQMLPTYEKSTWQSRYLRRVVCFHTYLLADRIAFKLCHTLVTIVAAARVLVSSPEAVGGLVNFSIYFWVIQGWNVALTIGRTNLEQGFEKHSFGRLGLSVLQICTVAALCLYLGSIDKAVKGVFYPFLLPYWLGVQVFFLPWANIFRTTGVIIVISMIGLAVSLAHQYWQDPYGLRHSARDLELARKVIEDSEIAPSHMVSLQDINDTVHRKILREADVSEPNGNVGTVQCPSTADPSTTADISAQKPEVMKKLT